MEKRADNYKRRPAAYAFLVILAFILAALVISQIALKGDGSVGKQLVDYCGNWERVYEDGTREEVTLPQNFDVPRGEKLVLETVLPEGIDEHLTLCYRSAHQSVTIYIDNQVVTEYDTSEGFFMGNNTASRYVFADLRGDDAGKVLRMEISSDSIYSGVVAAPCYGEAIAIWEWLVRSNIVSVGMAFFLLVIGFAIVVICVALSIVQKKAVELTYLGWTTFLVALWMLTESKLRQIIFHNSAAISYLAFILIMMATFSAALFMERVQEMRYKTAYDVAYWLLIAYFIFAMTLHLTKLFDLLQTMMITYLVSISVVIMIIVLIIIDIIRGYVRRYKWVATGAIILLFASLAELVLSVLQFRNLTGLAMGVGFLFLIVFCALHTILHYKNNLWEKEQAIYAVEMKDKFLASMSHELRTPINSVLGMNEMIIRESSEENIREYSKDIGRAGNMLLNLVNDILDFSKIESGQFQLIYSEYEPVVLFKELHQMIDERAADKNLDLIFELDYRIPSKLLGDEMRIKQIILNLLTNAVKYTKAGTVMLKAMYDVAEEKLVVSVSDTGQGIRPENIDKLFERFTRLEEGSNKGIEGTGLGLAITNNLISQMGGKIDVESEFGRGSVFTVTLPQKAVDVEYNLDAETINWFRTAGNRSIKVVSKLKNEVADTPVTTEKAEHWADGKTILVVDDNQMNIKVVKGLLKKSGIIVDAAESGKQALDMIKDKRYDLILMDHMMPEMDGIEAFHRMQKYWKNNGPEITTIALTANAINGMREKYLAEGFTDYLTKPIKPEDLENSLKMYLGDK